MRSCQFAELRLQTARHKNSPRTSK